jgi:hypothetical protein
MSKHFTSSMDGVLKYRYLEVFVILLAHAKVLILSCFFPATRCD